MFQRFRNKLNVILAVRNPYGTIGFRVIFSPW